jgi:peptidyl-prolyl cis-trans isomerase-like protein 2
MRVWKSRGIVFENSAILPYILKHKADPVTGIAMTSKELVALQMDRNEDTGQWQCPVINKPFLNHTKIVAIIQNDRSTANVYSYEAVSELNIKAKNYCDLISGEKFNRETDMILLQDPNDEELCRLRDINHFKHTNSLREQANEMLNKSKNIQLSITASRIIEKMKRKREDDGEKEGKTKENQSSTEESKKPKIFTDVLTGVSMTTGKASGSFTSTALNLTNNNAAREATEEEILQAKFLALKKLKKKGFVRFVTNYGDLDFELHCDIVPRTCSNFIGLCEKGIYNDSCFHRSIRNFMIQGGKPRDKKEVETSLWGDAFCDEFDDRLKHVGPGILSMANARPNTNKRQFFITFKSAPHLDRKHTVFGRVVNGLNVLSRMETVPTDKKDRPTSEIRIISVEVLYSPVEEAAEKERIRIQKRSDLKWREKEERRINVLGMSSTEAKVAKHDGTTKTIDLSIGKYIPKSVIHRNDIVDMETSKDGDYAVGMSNSRANPPPKTTKFGDFSGW